MKKVRNRTIEDETVALDDTEFRNCKFLNCQMNYSGALFGCFDCEITGCRYNFFDAAANTIRFLQYARVLEGGPKDWIAIPDTFRFPA